MTYFSALSLHFPLPSPLVTQACVDVTDGPPRVLSGVSELYVNARSTTPVTCHGLATLTPEISSFCILDVRPRLTLQRVVFGACFTYKRNLFRAFCFLGKSDTRWSWRK